MKQKRSFNEITTSNRIIRRIVAFLWISMMMLILTFVISAYNEQRRITKQEKDLSHLGQMILEKDMWAIHNRGNDYIFYNPPENSKEKD